MNDALLTRAEAQLAQLRTADEAEDLFREVTSVDVAARVARAHGEVQLRWGKLKLRAERRWGELLGPAEPGGNKNRVPGGHTVDSDRKAKQRARELRWDVDQDLFEVYLARVADAEQLRRARLLRIAREEEDDTPPPPVVKVGDVELRHGDLREVLGDLDGRVDVIVTDPPYPKKYLGEFDALGQLAARVLKDGGVLVVMVGQTHLPEYIARLSEHLTYRWCAAYLTPGPATRVHRPKVGTKWKPLLIYDRGGDRDFLTQDVLQSVAEDKRHHAWGQSESGMADIVERLTKPGMLVCDPFLGAGTTAVVCRDLGRHFVGCDIDAKAINRARKRLADD